MMAEETFWAFGYGSNMDIEHLATRKNVKVIEHSPAILKGWRLTFDFRAFDCVEPSYAGVKEQEGHEVHGCAFKVNVEQMASIDALEGIAYSKKLLPVETYDGRKIEAFVYINKFRANKDFKPSFRYKRVILSGAKSIGLKPEYIKKLEAIETYKPNEAVLEARAKYVPKDFSGLREITVDELAQHKEDGDVWNSMLGYVFKLKGKRFLWPYNKGRDFSIKALYHLNGTDMKLDESDGKPPYPLFKDLNEEEKFYLWCYVDQMMFTLDEEGEKVASVSEVIGYLKEWKEQQESGKTNFKFHKAE